MSPFLLLGALPKDWPGGCAKSDKPFAAFRTIDAQDLIKVHNTCCSSRIADAFVDQFEESRRKRNTIIHSVDKHLSVHVSELLIAILTINDVLGDEKNWVKVRRAYLENSPLSQMHSSDWAGPRIIAEFMSVRELLNPSEMKRFFNFDKKQRNTSVRDALTRSQKMPNTDHSVHFYLPIPQIQRNCGVLSVVSRARSSDESVTPKTAKAMSSRTTGAGVSRVMRVLIK